MTPRPSPSTAPVVVTGAGSGLGLRLGELLAARGRRVVALDLRLTDEARERLRRASAPDAGPVFAEVDVRDGDAVRRAFRTAVAETGAPALVVNCAGVQDALEFSRQSEEAFRRVVDVNLLGSRNVAAAAIDVLPAGGQLVLVASLAGLVPNFAYAAYCASKYAVVGLAEVLRLELEPRGVRVSLVCPPEVETPMVATERETMRAPTRALKAMAGTLPLEPAVREILAGIDARASLIVPGRRARFTRHVARLLPASLLRGVTDRVVRRELAEERRLGVR
ncbi:SDR family NAD(P)-dependent oxidoreductase [Patulibacter sp. S7RM1-6]